MTSALLHGLALVALTSLLATTSQAEDLTWRHGMATVGDLKYQKGFERFDYVNPQAPKGGDVNLSVAGTFDSFNPIAKKGNAAAGLSLVFDTLLVGSEDEVTAAYGLLAESFAYPDDISYASYRLRPEARWADGTPVTPEDVVYSFDKAKEHNPEYFSYYKHVVSAEKSGEREVTFRFDEKDNRELPQILGQFPVVPKHWWEGKDAQGKARDISGTTLEPVMGSGPYRIAAFSAGGRVRYERREDYWAKDLNVNVGQNNFGAITYLYFGDRNVEFEAFRAGGVDYWQENQASRWATGYDFPAVKDGRVKREEIANPFRATGVMQAMVPNMRREIFKDQRVRKALNYALDFEDLNRTIFFNQYKRIDSFFFGTELASSGLPQGRELEILTEIKDKVPASVFTESYVNPVGGDPAKSRANLRQALSLLQEAGYALKGNKLVAQATGKPLAFEILLSSPALERAALPYANSLRRLGIEVSVRTVDDSQYVNRTRAFYYDMTWVVWAQSLNPGNEQTNYWGSSSVDRPGSRNYAGISDPGIDHLVQKVIFAKNRDEQVASIRAMDRVLLAHDYVVPLYYRMAAPIAYWNRVVRPETLPRYGLGFPAAWWSAAAKAP
jgi:microcin C transport system substrate-binding protein